MQQLVDTYALRVDSRSCDDPERQRALPPLRERAAGRTTRSSFVEERGQKRPADWTRARAARGRARAPTGADALGAAGRRVADVPRDGGVAVAHGDAQLAIFHFAARGALVRDAERAARTGATWCSARGLLGDAGRRAEGRLPACTRRPSSSRPARACRIPSTAIATFPVKVEEGKVYVKLPPAEPDGRSALCGRLRRLLGRLLVGRSRPEARGAGRRRRRRAAAGRPPRDAVAVLEVRRPPPRPRRSSARVRGEGWERLRQRHRAGTRACARASARSTASAEVLPRGRVPGRAARSA